MKLTFVNPTGVIGGAEMCLLDLLASLSETRPSPELRVILGDEGPLETEVRAIGVSCEVLPLPGRLAALGDAGLGLEGGKADGRLGLAARGSAAIVSASSYLKDLRRRLKANLPDLIQTNGMKAHVLGAWAAPRGVPVIWHLHDYLGSRAVMGRLLRLSARPGVSGVAVSHSVGADAAEVLGRKTPVSVVHNAVDLDRFRPGPGDGDWLDIEAGFPPAESASIVRVGLVATFARWKGHDVYLDAISRLPSDLPVRFYVVGGPIYKSAGSQHDLAALRSRAEELGLGGRVGFAGHQPDPAAVYRALDVVVHASTRPEPFGRVIVEGMACGRVVVASPLGGAAELIENGVTALAIGPGDDRGLSNVLARLVSDAELRDRLGRAGRVHVEARFNRCRLAGEWSEVYNAALAGRRKEPTAASGRNHEGRAV